MNEACRIVPHGRARRCRTCGSVWDPTLGETSPCDAARRADIWPTVIAATLVALAAGAILAALAFHDLAWEMLTRGLFRSIGG